MPRKGSKRGGISQDPTYRTWAMLKQRCLNRRFPHYQDYGGSGITICTKWLRYEGFLEDMGPRPGPEFALSRINNTGNYQLDNCRWATKSQSIQNSRKRRNCSSSYQGVCLRKNRLRKKWHAYIYLNGKRRNLGYFEDEEDAARAYNVVAKELFGEHAGLNELPSQEIPE